MQEYRETFGEQKYNEFMTAREDQLEIARRYGCLGENEMRNLN